MKILQRFGLGFIAAAWLTLGYLQVQSALRHHTLLPLLLAAESVLVGFRLLNRRPDLATPRRWYVRAAVWVYVFWGPLLLRVDQEVPLIGTILACAGVGLTLWALWSLGPSFGIAPADRGLVTYGPYRYLRHPMYAGALLNMLPAVLWNPTLWNLGVAALILGISLLRIHLEERTVTAYSQYADRVRWRLIPFVW